MTEFAQLIGTTRSSKVIRQPVSISITTLTELTSDYGPNDHFDAYALFEFLLSRELARIGRDSPRADLYQRFSAFHRELLTDEEMERQKKILGIATVFDVIKFGNSRSHTLLVNERPLRIK